MNSCIFGNTHTSIYICLYLSLLLHNLCDESDQCLNFTPTDVFLAIRINNSDNVSAQYTNPVRSTLFSLWYQKYDIIFQNKLRFASSMIQW